ncbi:MAG: hypothetical protein BroJett030_21810 [Alphaproteobacteria bacterium]|nr:MAG: hypothetical protein BroJett030_21810 [Alphaproteobacteria bacterium]
MIGRPRGGATGTDDMECETDYDPDRDLAATRLFDAPPSSLWRAWTEPALVMRWFTPAPWTMVDCSIDLHPGGAFSWTMRSPQGEEGTHEACYLDIVENERLVWTDALGPGYRPAVSPFITVSVRLAEQSGRTRLTCLIRHKDAATRQIHLDKGFEQGWGTCLDQLADVVRRIRA